MGVEHSKHIPKSALLGTDDQSSVFRICCKEQPLLKAAEAAAPLKECVLNKAVSIPELLSTSFSHLATVFVHTDLYETYEINN